MPICGKRLEPRRSSEQSSQGHRHNGPLLTGILFSFARLRVARTPVFRRKRNPPKRGTRHRKLQANFRFSTANRSEKCDVAFLFFLGSLVLHLDGGSAGDASFEKNQGSVGVDRQSLGVLLKRFSLGIRTLDANRHLHQDALAATAAETCGYIWNVTHEAP